MKTIDEQKLESDIQYRYQYLAEFIEYTAEEAATIGRLRGQLEARIPAMVQATYDKLLAFDATARHFIQPQAGQPASSPPSLGDISIDHANIKFRKEHLRRYLMILLANPYDSQMVKYLDMVGKIHTPAAGNKQIHVPLIQMNVLMGLLGNLIIKAIQELGLDVDAERASILAFNKILWIQNDFIQRHYGYRTTSLPQPDATSADARQGWR